MNQQLAEFVVGAVVKVLALGWLLLFVYVPQIVNIGVGRVGGG